MKLHQRGVDLLLNVQDAMQHPGRLSPKDIRGLLEETEAVLRELLARDIPTQADDAEKPDTQGTNRRPAG